MAAYTSVTAQDISKALSHFPEMGALRSYAPISEGVTNSNYKIICDKGEYILTLFELTTDYPHLPFFIRVIRAAAKAGLPVPAPLNEQVLTLHHKPAVICPFFPGRPPSSPPLPSEISEAGAALGRFHHASSQLQETKKNTWSLEACASFFHHNREAVQAHFPACAIALEEELAYVTARLRNIPSLRKGVIHGDLFPDNTLFESGHISAVLDWYYACTEPLIYDIAICLNAWCFDAGERHFDFASSGRFIQRYLEHAGQEAGEDLHALPLFLRLAATRFLTSRLQAALFAPNSETGTQHDPQSYLRRLLFHRNVPSWQMYVMPEHV